MSSCLSGTYRVGAKELGAMCELRINRKMRLSINQIADVFDRSTSTVHSYVGKLKYDNRRAHPTVRRNRNRQFTFMLPSLRLKIKMYFKGLFQTIEEALLCKTIPISSLDWFLETENSPIEEEEDPA